MKIIVKTSLYFIFIVFTSILFGQYFQGQLACPHCGVNKIDREFLRQLKLLENKCSFYFEINSGYRCEVYNRDIEGYINSDHLYGLAVDISVFDSEIRNKLETLVENSGYFTTFYKYPSHIHIGSGGYGFTSTWKEYPYDDELSSLNNTVFAGIGLKYTMIEDKFTPHASLRFGYFIADEEYELDNYIYYMDIASDKLTNNKTSDFGQNQIALGAGWSSYVDPHYYSLNLSTGLGFLNSHETSDKQKKDTYYFLEPSINFGLLFQYVDWQINLGYTLTKGVKLGNLDDNNVGGFHFTVVVSMGSFWN